MEVGEFTPRKKSSNRDYCAVTGCESRASENLNVSFHHFPRPNERFVNRQNIFGDSEKIDLFNAWTIALNIRNITKRTTICSLHFQKSDYFFAGKVFFYLKKVRLSSAMCYVYILLKIFRHPSEEN